MTIEGVFLVCGTAGAPRPEAWDDFNRALATTEASSVLVLSLGTVRLTSAQRSASADIIKKRKLRVAVLTGDTLMRRVIDVIAWLGPDLRAYAWSEMDRALEDLGATGERAQKLREAADEMANLVRSAPLSKR